MRRSPFEQFPAIATVDEPDNIAAPRQTATGQPPFDQSYDDVLYRWRFFFCDGTGCRLHNDYYAQIRWVPEAALREYEFDPVSQRVVDWMLDRREE